MNNPPKLEDQIFLGVGLILMVAGALWPKALFRILSFGIWKMDKVPPERFNGIRIIGAVCAMALIVQMLIALGKMLI